MSTLIHRTCRDDDRSSIRDAIVVGGGISGLTAAHALTKEGLDVVLFEEGDHPGGRVRTIHYGNLYAEAGAMVVTDEEVATLALLKELAIDSFVDAGPHGVELYLGKRCVRMRRIDGQIRGILDLCDLAKFFRASLPSRQSGLPTPGPNLLLSYRRALKEIQQESQDISYPYDPAKRTDWDTLSFAQFLDRYHPNLHRYIDLQLKVTAGETADLISLFWGLVTFKWNTDGSFYWIQGGTSRLAETLANCLGGAFHLKTHVESVATSGDVAVVRASSAGTPIEARARTVVIAIPPPAVLRVVAGLEHWKRAALEAVRYGGYIPVHLRCRTRFWEATIRTGYLNCASVCFADLVDATKGQPGKEGILLAFIAGPEARRLLSASDTTILEEVVTDLERIFPGCSNEILEKHVFRWPNGIAYFPVGYAEAFRDLRQPQGRLFFCGDYTEGAGIDDAVLSGKRAARGVLDFLAS